MVPSSKPLGRAASKDQPTLALQLDFNIEVAEVSPCNVWVVSALPAIALAALAVAGGCGGVGSHVQADPLLQQQYAKKACAAGSKTSCDVDKLVGKVDSAGNTAARGNALFQSKCDAGDAMACGLLGENLLAGIGIGVDRDRGMTLLKKACDGGVDRACKKLADATQ